MVIYFIQIVHEIWRLWIQINDYNMELCMGAAETLKEVWKCNKEKHAENSFVFRCGHNYSLVAVCHVKNSRKDSRWEGNEYDIHSTRTTVIYMCKK